MGYTFFYFPCSVTIMSNGGVLCKVFVSIVAIMLPLPLGLPRACLFSCIATSCLFSFS